MVIFFLAEKTGSSWFDIDNVMQAFLQSLITSGILATIAYFVQRRHKLLDSYKTEKNKALLSKTIDAEYQIYEIINNVRSRYFWSDSELINFSNAIQQKRKDNYLYITDGIYKISNEFADYLLVISTNIALRDINKEEKFAKQFKNEFRK